MWYDLTSKWVEVVFPHPGVQDQVEAYLAEPRVYRIPKSQKIDDYREEVARLVDYLMHMELDLNIL